MSIVQLNKVTKFFADDLILNDVSFSLYQGEKAALVGVNGSGKTTIMKIITGLLSVDEGNVFIASQKKVGYSEQHIDLNPEDEIFDYVISSFSEVLLMRENIKELEKKISVSSEKELKEILEEYGRIREEYEKINGYSIEAQTRKVLNGLGFSNEDFIKTIRNLSGGEKRRVSICKLLVSQPDILLLDEPTNHLDLEAIQWLEDYLVSYPGTVLLISHDQYFLDKVVSVVLEVNNKKVYSYPGNYTKFEFLKAERMSTDKKAFEKEQKEVKSIQEYIRKYKAGIKTKQARGREKQLARRELLQDVFHNKNINLRFSKTTHTGKEILKIEGFKKEIHSELIFKDISFLITAGEAIGIIGPNGAGKTSFINGIIHKTQEKGKITLGAGVKLSYFDQYHSSLHPENTIFQEITNNFDITFEKARGMLASVLFFEDDLDKKIKSLSGGEKSRISFIKLILEEPNFLILDEPTNHLDMESKNIIIQALSEFEGTILFVSHDRLLLDLLSTKIMIIEKGQVSFFEGSYSEYLDKKNSESQKEKSKNTNEKKPNKSSQSKGINIYKVNKRNEELEQLIEELEKRHGELNLILTDTELYKDFQKYGELSEELKSIDEKMEEVMEEWSDIQQLLEEY